MWLDGAAEVAEMFKNSFPLSFLFFIPLFIIISPISPVDAAQEFAVHRMQQYDLHGTAYGCRSALVNMEVRSIEAKMVTRRCVITQLRDVTAPRIRELISQNAGAVLILLPDELPSLATEEMQHLQNLEKDLLSAEISIPVFFTHKTDNLESIYNDVQSGSAADQASTAVEALLSSATANGFQMVASGSQAKSLPDFQITNIQGRLSGYGIEEQLPTIFIVAHYDSFGIAPGLSYGGDSNGSGVIALLELSRLFAKLYTNSRTHAKFNLVFLLSGGGKFNYQGTKRWIEDSYDSSDSNLLSEAAYVLCLDSLGSGDSLSLHVSKPPKDDSPGGVFLKNLDDVISIFHPEVKFNTIHKKINLADDMLAWEHERFSIKRLQAFTLSHFESHKNLNRTSILDGRSSVQISTLARNIEIVAEALARHLYNLTSQSSMKIFTEPMNVQESLIEALTDYLTSQSRAAQVLDKDHMMLSTLEETMNRYLKDVKKSTFKADKRDPEFVFYDGTEYTMSAYSVKPAVFDLFLAAGIASYLGLVYLFIQNFALMSALLTKFVRPVRIKSH